MMKLFNTATTLEEAHASLVHSLSKDGGAIRDEMTAQSAHLLHMAIGVSGESGELLDAVKKHTIYNKDLDRDNVVEEIGDIEFYLEGLRRTLNISREETLEANIAKLEKRYGKTYSDKKAQERADKQ